MCIMVHTWSDTREWHLNMNAEDMSQLASLEIVKTNIDYLEVLNKCSTVSCWIRCTTLDW